MKNILKCSNYDKAQIVSEMKKVKIVFTFFEFLEKRSSFTKYSCFIIARRLMEKRKTSEYDKKMSQSQSQTTNQPMAPQG